MDANVYHCGALLDHGSHAGLALFFLWGSTFPTVIWGVGYAAWKRCFVALLAQIQIVKQVQARSGEAGDSRWTPTVGLVPSSWVAGAARISSASRW